MISSSSDALTPEKSSGGGEIRADVGAPKDVRGGPIGPEGAIAAPQVSVQDQLAYASTRIGRTLCDRWHLDGVLGVGGMASVYAATHRNGNRVAIKILHPELSAYAELKERFMEEGYAANHVAHPGVVAVHDDGTSEDGAVFLVMNLLEGETLQARSQRPPFPFSHREVLMIADQILDILEAAHRNGIVHRDIKPENIFLTNDGAIKLLDFGIAHNEHSRRTHRTRAGSAMGTPAFMPPEQARGRADEIDGRTDVWALGATLFWLVTGHCVRSEETSNEELLKAMTEPAPAVLPLAPHAPPALAQLIDTALAFEKPDRFASAKAMRVAVRATYAALEHGAYDTLPPFDPSATSAARPLSAQSPPSQASPSTYRPVSSGATPAFSPQPGRRRRRVLVGIVAALGVLIVGVVHFGKPEIGSLMHVAAARGSGFEIRPKNVERAHSAASPPLAREREPAAASDQQTPSLPVSGPPARDPRAPGSATRPVRAGNPRALATPNSVRAGAQSRAVPARPKRGVPGAPGAAPDSSSAQLPAQPSAARAVAPDQRDPLSRRK